jgi:pilus assembly protein FimV
MKPIEEKVLPLTPVETPKLTPQPITLGNAKTDAEIEAEISRIEAEAKSKENAPQPNQSFNPVPEVKPEPVLPKAASLPTQKKTRSGDNLTSIASSMRVPGVSLNQMLVGLYEYNKDAFVDGNMNRLRVGKVIKLPSKDALLAMSKREANNTVVLHTSNWRAYRNSLATAVTTSNFGEESTSQQTDSGKIAAVEPEKQAPLVETKDVVKLSAGEQAKISKDAKLAEEAKKAAEEEDQIANQKALNEAEERTKAVEKQIEDMQKLLAMKNEAMDELQTKAEVDNQVAINETEQSESDKPKAEGEPANAVDEAHQSEAEKPHEAKPVVKEEQAPQVEAIVEEPSFFASLKDSVNLPIIGGLLGVLGLIGAWLFLRNKRRKDLESFERGILTSGGLRANTVFGNTTGTATTTDTSFLTDFAQSTDGSMMDANEVDPIAEAEVYMAYGREAQAEEILKDAIKKEPKRYELHTKLLEIYAERKDASAFETVAGELYTTLGSDDPVWEKVAEMGKVLEPENPLYSQKVSVAKVSVSNPTETNITKETDVNIEYELPVLDSVVNQVDDKLDRATDAVQEKSAVIAGVAATAIAKGGSRIESIVRHEPNNQVESEEVKSDTLEDEVENSIDFEIDSALNLTSTDDEDRIQKGFDSDDVEDITIDADFDVSEEMKEALEEVSEGVEDLNFELDETSSEEPMQTLAETDAFDLSGISLDLDGNPTEMKLDEEEITAPELSGDDNEVEVKLNLVAAYIDMDDKEGAKELLDEVIKEGTEDQVMRAQMMLDSIS